jgi:hypothetical protein
MLNKRIADEAFENNTSRRDFLVLSQRLLLSTAVLTMCPISLRASDMDALNLRHLDSSSALMLADVSRLLFPHDRLADTIYLDVVRDIDSDMHTQKKIKLLISQATKILNDKAGGDWLIATLSKKLDLLKTLQGSEEFSYLHNRTIESLYRNPEVWKLLGYQGSSIEHGGYLHRGFDDIDWLEI